MKDGYVYIMCNRGYGTLYVGVTSDICRRAYEYRQSAIEGFSKKYGLHRLVYYKGPIIEAIAREKNLKNWKRQWKIELIERYNPNWRDLFEDLI
jgi:putative endonuclease